MAINTTLLLMLCSLLCAQDLPDEYKRNGDSYDQELIVINASELIKLNALIDEVVFEDVPNIVVQIPEESFYYFNDHPDMVLDHLKIIYRCYYGLKIKHNGVGSKIILDKE